MRPVALVPSNNKGRQWENFVATLSDRAQGTPTSVRLRKLHHIFSDDLDLGLLFSEHQYCEAQLIVLDRPDWRKKQELLADPFNTIKTELGRPEIHVFDILVHSLSGYARICSRDTEVEFDPQLRGELRSFGRRKIGDGNWERVYYAHTCTFDEDGGSLAPMYYGLSVGLPETYEALCSRYECLMADAHSFDEKLLAESFLQLIGTRLLHPFIDANGRTFAAHLVEVLQQEGIKIVEYRHAKALTTELTQVNRAFLFEVLASEGLGLVCGKDHVMINLDFDYRNSYMTRLRRAIETAIEHGIDSAGRYYEHFARAVWRIKKYLTPSGFLPESEEHRRKITQYVDENETRLACVPDVYRDYFKRLLKDCYIHQEDMLDGFYHAFDIFSRTTGMSERHCKQLVDGLEFYKGNLVVQVQIVFQCAYAIEKSAGLEEIYTVVNALCNEKTRDVVLSWPEEVSGLYIMPHVFGIALQHGTASIRPMVAALEDEEIKEFFDRHKDLGLLFISTVCIYAAKHEDHTDLTRTLRFMDGLDDARIAERLNGIRHSAHGGDIRIEKR